MHEYVGIKHQHPTEKFHKKTQKHKIFPKAWKPRSKCTKWMRNERKKGFRPLTKGLKLDRGIEIIGFEMIRVEPQIYRKTQLDRSRRYREQNLDRSRGIDGKKISIDQRGIEQTETPKNWLDRSSYLSRGIENKPRNLDKRGMYRGAI